MNSTTAIDATSLKAATRAQWERHAEGWNASAAVVRHWLRESTDAMLAMAEIRPGMRVIDVAAGSGDQTLDIAERVGAGGSVLATDLSPAILEFAKENARREGYSNVETQVADGEDLKVPDASFDAAICRLGLMFFPNPALGLREMFRAVKPGARACTLVFSGLEKNPCIRILMATALKHAGLPPRDPYQPGGLLSLGKPALIDNLFEQAGFTRVATTQLCAPFRLFSVGGYLNFIRSSASPILQILERLDDLAKQAARADIEDQLRACNTRGGWEGPNELLLTVGQRP